MVERELKHLFEFGPFCLDTRERILSRDCEPVPLTPKSFEILLALVENRGHTLTKDELVDRVWPDSFVEIGNLNRNISTLRHILGDDSRNPRFIKTFPKRGYRFDADVREIVQNEEEVVIERRTNYRFAFSRESASTNLPNGTRLTRLRLTVSLIAAVVIIGIGIVLFGGTGYLERSEAQQIFVAEPNAEDLLQIGRSFWRDRTGESLHKATVVLEQAVTLEPKNARAHAALADAYVFDNKGRVRSEDSAQTAIALDPSLGEPHATLGFSRMFWDWRFEEAEAHYDRALLLSPNYGTGRQWYALNLAAQGHGNAALAEIKMALELEPDSPAISADMCHMLYLSRRVTEAESQCRSTLKLFPSFLSANLILYEILSIQGRYREAVDQFFKIEGLIAHYATKPKSLSKLRNSYSKGGIRRFWRARIETLETHPRSAYVRARYYARLGDLDGVFRELTKAFEDGEHEMMFFLAEPLFVDCCFSDPRYASLEEAFLREGRSRAR